jgi:arylsulfatase A-like enzyme
MATRKRQRTLAVIACLAALDVAAACSRSEPETRADAGAPAPRLVVLYAPCTVNTRYLSPYNPGVTYTPCLEAFANRATVFTRHQTEAGVSGIAFASIFSGTDAHEHGAYTHPRWLPDSVELITEVFQDAGYEVFTWLKHPMANARLNYAQGVDDEHRSSSWLRANDPVFLQILDHLRTDPSYRALVVTNFTLTHRPYRAMRLDEFCREHPDECRPRQDREAFDRYAELFQSDHIPFAYDFDRTVQRHGLTESDVANLIDVIDVLYKAGIYHLDQAFGAVVSQIERHDLLPESVIAFTADHGELLYRPGVDFVWCHAFQLAPEVLNVPLIIYAPGAAPGGGVYDGVTRSIDVLPTLAGLAGVPMPDYTGPGVDLSQAMAGRAPPSPLLAFSHAALLPDEMAGRLDELGRLREVIPAHDPDLMWVAVRSGDDSYKLRWRNGRLVASVYDLAADPNESTDLYDPAAPWQAPLLERLEAYRASLIDSYDDWKNRAENLDEHEQLRILRSLGYVK